MDTGRPGRGFVLDRRPSTGPYRIWKVQGSAAGPGRTAPHPRGS
ncbi:hypothetical protein ACFFX0_12425 [Citricoccus parietis]|uniref:Uncharacterized protein n=1 Tax=Citricoccus parietis TaxID=592307 RepID=A0ABV5FZ64_9MICC